MVECSSLPWDGLMCRLDPDTSSQLVVADELEIRSLKITTRSGH